MNAILIVSGVLMTLIGVVSILGGHYLWGFLVLVGLLELYCGIKRTRKNGSSN
jgi:hypothetical protein